MIQISADVCRCKIARFYISEGEREKKVREAEGKKEREKDDGVANLQPWGNTLRHVVFSTCFNTACAERLGRC